MRPSPAGEGETVHFQSSECAGCRREFPSQALDADDWCDECRPRMRRRAKRGRHLIAALITLPFAIWILVLDRGETLSPAVWLLPIAGAYYLGLRIGREVVRGISRWRAES